MGLIVATAPGRCGIVGNPADMYGGSVLSCTVQERATCRLENETNSLSLHNEDESAVLTTRDDYALQGDKLDIARAALNWFGIDPAQSHFSLSLHTDIPMRAGLAGSTALLAAIVGALTEFAGQRLEAGKGRRPEKARGERDGVLPAYITPYWLAETTRKIENRVMGIVCGLQDQHMAVFGGLNFMDYAGKEDLEQRDDEPLATIEPLASLLPEPPLLLAHTGIQHHSGTVHTSPRQRWLAGEPLVRAHYARLGQLAKRGKRALLEHDWVTLGALMNENHTLVSELGGSGPANDHLIETARKAGAWGAKLAGAGGGGTIIALTDDPEKVGKALLEAGAERLLTPRPQPGLTVTQE